jgi:hypothetical protein
MFAVNLANEDPNILYLLWAAPYLAVNTLRTGFTAARTLCVAPFCSCLRLVLR